MVRIRDPIKSYSFLLHILSILISCYFFFFLIMTRPKKLVTVCCVSLGISLLVFFGFVKRETPFFFPLTMPDSLPFHPEWETAPLEDALTLTLDEILAQPFTYLGKGEQSYAFVSQDQHYVIKFPFLKRQHKKTRKTHIKLQEEAEKCLLAWHRFKEETGLVYAHFNRTSHLKRTLSLQNDRGDKMSLNLDQVAFLIQRKANPLFQSITQWMQEGEISVAKNALSQLVELLRRRSSIGIQDLEEHLEENYVFIENQPIQIDFGHFHSQDCPINQAVEKDKMLRLLTPLKTYLNERYPDLGKHLEECVN